MHDCLIAFGSNQGNRLEVFQNALEKLSQTKQLRVLASSDPLNTLPVGGPENQGVYLNAAIRLETDLSPGELHLRLVEIENQLGRLRRTRWGARLIDLDLLLFGRQMIKSANLVIPHPRMSFRRFVIQPAADIAGDMVHPPSGLTIKQLNARLNDCENLILWAHDPEFEIFLDQMSARIRAQFPDWRIEPIREWDQSSSELASRAKLVTYFPSDRKSNITSGDPVARPTDSSAESKHWAATFSGATLELPRDVAPASIEILAAIDAMKP